MAPEHYTLFFSCSLQLPLHGTLNGVTLSISHAYAKRRTEKNLTIQVKALSDME